MIIEGYREVKRALDNHHMPTTLFFCKELFQGHNEPSILDRCLQAQADVLECTQAVFAKLSYRDRPDGLLALAPQVHSSLESLELPANPLIVIAESIEKPGNLGTILRTAEAAGATGVIVADPTTDPFNPNVVRASLGTLFLIPLAVTATQDALDWLQSRSIRSVATTPEAAIAYYMVDLTGPVALVIGSEQYGLSGAWINGADERVVIPTPGSVDSLNAAMAAGILLFEAVRQRVTG